MKNIILHGSAIDKLKTIPENTIDMCMTSPPYWGLRDYQEDGQLGMEKDYNEYITKLCDIFDEVKRVLKKEGSCCVNLGDTYLPNKSLCMVPQRFAIEMINRGWILRNTIIWQKPNAMPENVKDRFTVDFEFLYFFVKQPKYYFKQQFESIKYNSLMRKRRGNNKNKYSGYQSLSQVRENKGYDNLDEEYNNHPGRNKRAVWNINTTSFHGQHLATYPEELCKTPIDAGCPENGIVLDPFMGAGTTALAAINLNKNFLGIELNKNYIDMAMKRIQPYLEQGKLFQKEIL